jgi:NodT family efflux transporter outer membrane factor (OMF) lipoprotein
MSKIMINLRLKAALCSAITTLSLTGCLVGPKYHVPPATAQAPPTAYKESPTQFQDTDGWKVAQPQDAMLRGKWWEIYNEPELNALEDRLNINNQNIKQFFENFMEARTLIAQARSQLYPTLTTAPTSYTRSRSSANLSKTATANTGSESSIGTLGLDASWEPDLWGKVRNTIHEEQYNAQLSAADLENERLTEQATLAVTFFEIRGQDALQKVLDDTVVADTKALELTRSLYDTGIDDRISVVEAENTLQNAQATATNLGVARAQYEHAIAVLVGENASGFSILVKPVTATPPPIPVGLPSQLLERRPDIAASERAMASANAQIGIADAAYYPDLTLSAEGGLESSTFKHLLDWPSRFWSIGPSVNETIFDAGLRRATVNQFIATYNADVASYRQTVLTAFQQVEDALATVRILSQQIKQQQGAEQSAQQFVKLETARYETGVDPYIDVVTAQTTLLADQQTLTTLRVQRMTASVQLIEALGGGWDRSQLPTPAQVSKKLTKGETTIQQ